MKKTLSRGLAGALCVGLMIGSCVSVGAEGKQQIILAKFYFYRLTTIILLCPIWERFL
ncbi:MAG: hypothetical protein ACLTZM_07325 [Ruminococcus sp.]